MSVLFDFHSELENNIRLKREQMAIKRQKHDKKIKEDLKQFDIRKLESAKPTLDAFLSPGALEFLKKNEPFDLSTSAGVSKFKRRILLQTHPDKQQPEHIYHNEFNNFFEAYKKWTYDLDVLRSSTEPTISIPSFPAQMLAETTVQQPMQQNVPIISITIPSTVLPTTFLTAQNENLSHHSSKPITSFIDKRPRVVDVVEDICIDSTTDLCDIRNLDDMQIENVEAFIPFPTLVSPVNPSLPISRKKSKKQHHVNVTPLDTFSKKQRHTFDQEVSDDDFHLDEKVVSPPVKIECKTLESKKFKDDTNWIKLAKLLIQYAKENNIQNKFVITEAYDFILETTLVEGSNYAKKTHRIRNWQQGLKTQMLKFPLYRFRVDGCGTIEQILIKKKEGGSDKIYYQLVDML